MRTLYDWVKQARTAGGPEAARCLREAEPLVERARDWAMLAEGWAALGSAGHADARRCADRAVEGGGTEVFVYREVATVFAGALGDPASARRALDRCFEVYAKADTSAGDWRYLAGGYARVLGDQATSRHCLEYRLSQPRAMSVDELCALADGFVEHLDDRTTARALVERATALAETTPPSDLGAVLWTLANVHRHALGDPEAGWSILERGLSRATTVAACLRLARAVACHTTAEPARRPLEVAFLSRAESLVGSADDCIAVAAASHEHRRDPSDIRRCLEQALARQPDDAERQRIAFGYRHWLGDGVTADQVSARGLAPAALVITRRRLEQWEPDPAALLDWLRERITPKALATIAAADYGNDRDTHLAALRDIQATGLIPQPLTWHPTEVLALTRWSSGDNVDHMARAFACTVLCLDSAGPVHRDGHEATIAVLLESCLALGDEAVSRAVGLMVTLAQAADDDHHELGFAYLGLLLAAAVRDPHDPRLASLADRLVATELSTRLDSHQDNWLLGQTLFDARHRLWRSLAEDLLAKPSRGDPSLVHLADIAERLRGPS
jgi:hypothetical protein